MLGVAQGTNEGDEVEAELVLGLDDQPLGLGPHGAAEARAVAVATASDLDHQAEVPFKGHDGASVGVGGPEGMLAFRAARGQGG